METPPELSPQNRQQLLAGTRYQIRQQTARLQSGLPSYEDARHVLNHTYKVRNSKAREELLLQYQADPKSIQPEPLRNIIHDLPILQNLSELHGLVKYLGGVDKLDAATKAWRASGRSPAHLRDIYTAIHQVTNGAWEVLSVNPNPLAPRVDKLPGFTGFIRPVITLGAQTGYFPSEVRSAYNQNQQVKLTQETLDSLFEQQAALRKRQAELEADTRLDEVEKKPIREEYGQKQAELQRQLTRYPTEADLETKALDLITKQARLDNTLPDFEPFSTYDLLQRMHAMVEKYENLKFNLTLLLEKSNLSRLSS